MGRGGWSKHSLCRRTKIRLNHGCHQKLELDIWVSCGGEGKGRGVGFLMKINRSGLFQIKRREGERGPPYLRQEGWRQM